MKLLTRLEELILLAILKLEDNAYCVTIFDHVEGVSDKKGTIGSIYLPLYRLEKAGFIVSHLGKPSAERGGKRKRFYTVTPQGIRALKEVKKVHAASWEGISDLLIE